MKWKNLCRHDTRAPVDFLAQESSCPVQSGLDRLGANIQARGGFGNAETFDRSQHKNRPINLRSASIAYSSTIFNS